MIRRITKIKLLTFLLSKVFSFNCNFALYLKLLHSEKQKLHVEETIIFLPLGEADDAKHLLEIGERRAIQTTVTIIRIKAAGLPMTIPTINPTLVSDGASDFTTVNCIIFSPITFRSVNA